MNIAVVGSGGYIAGYILQQLNEDSQIKPVLKIGKRKESDLILDLEYPEKFDYQKLKEIDYIIFTAAVSAPDKCASDFDLCWKINVIGTNFFIHKALDYGCRVIFFSSDAVYGKDIGKCFDEFSETRAYTPYGRMKKAVEDEFKNIARFKSIRLSYVVSATDRFTSYCMSCIKEKRIAEIFHPFYRNCITIKEVVDAVCWLIYHFDKLNSPVLNMAGKELVSRVRIADEISRLFDGKLTYKIIVPDDDFFENRPKITQMKSLFLQEYKIIDDCSFTEALKNVLCEVTDEN